MSHERPAERMSAGANAVRRIALINFTGIRPNWGCQATSWEWLKFIDSALPPGQLPEVVLIPLLPRHGADEQLDRHHDTLCEAIEDVAAGRPGTAAKLAFLEQACRERYGDYADAVESSDAVFFQAEGTMTGTDAVRGLRLLLLPFVAKHAWGKSVYAFNHTVFICEPRFASVAAAAFNSFDFNAVREPISLSAARACGMDPVYHVPDTAFLTEPAGDTRLPQLDSGTHFAVTGSAFPEPGVHERIFELADRVRAETGLVPTLAASTKADRALVRLAQDRWAVGSYAVIPHELGYSAVAQALRSCAFLLGGRYHLAILAASVGTPAVQLRGNSYKNEGLSALLGGLATVRDLSDVEQVVADSLALTRDGGDVRRRLANRRTDILEALEAARRWLSSTLAGQAAPVPESFVQPPGETIDHRDYLEPYCAHARAQASSFRYPPDPRLAMGEPPRAENMLPAIADSCLAGQAGAITVLRQLAASNPDVRAALAQPGNPLNRLAQ